MLQGSIIKLSYVGEKGWRIEIEDRRWHFITLTDLDRWLCNVIEKAADRHKASLMIADREKLILPEFSYR